MEPSFEQLVAYVSGEAEGADRTGVEAALASSTAVREQVGQLRRLVRSLTLDVGAAPSVALLARTYGALERRPKRTLADWLSRAEQVTASILFDSRTSPAVAGFRGESSGVYIAMESSGALIDVRATAGGTPSDPLTHVVGRVEVLDDHALDAVVLAGDEASDEIDATIPDDEGRFSFEVPPSRYRIIAEMDGGALAIISSPLDMR